MRKALLILTAMVASLTALSARAEPLDAKSLPAQARWVMHMDVDALRQTRLWATVHERLRNHPDFIAKSREIEEIFSARIPEDLHSVTLYGESFDETSAVVLIHARMESARVQALLQLNPDFAAVPHGDYKILSWEDKGKLMHGSFQSPQRLVIARSEDRVKRALDVIDARVPTMAAGKLPGAGAGVLAYVAGEGLEELAAVHRAQSPLVGQMESAWISFAEQGDQVLASAAVQAVNETAAQQMKQALEGIKAMAILAGNSQHAGEKARLVAQLMPALSASVEGRRVQAQWPVPLATLKAMTELRPATQPATSNSK